MHSENKLRSSPNSEYAKLLTLLLRRKLNLTKRQTEKESNLYDRNFAYTGTLGENFSPLTGNYIMLFL